MDQRHAFLIMAHNEPQILSALLGQLDYPGFDVYLHVDAKSRQMQEEFADYRPRRGGFHLLDRHVDVRWGDIAQVEVEMLLLRTAAQHGPYVYYHIMSGVDLMLKTPKDFCKVFSSRPHPEYVGFWCSSSHLRDLQRKTGRVYLFTKHLKDKGTFVHAWTSMVRNVVLAMQKAVSYRRSAPKGITFCKGSNWVSITEEFCQYVLRQEPKLHPRLRHMLCPDEIFLQTLLWNSPFRSRIHDGESEDTLHSTLRKIDWQRGSPYTWTESEVEELLESGAVFARKFSSSHMKAVEEIVNNIQMNNEGVACRD